MINKEIRDLLPALTIRLILSTVIVMATACLILSNNDKGMMDLQNFIDTCLLIGWIPFLWIAHHMGVTGFHNEYKDRAVEYLLSTPLSRGRLVLYKVLPRALLLFGILGLFFLMKSLFLSSEKVLSVSIPSPFNLTIIMFCVLFSSFFLSIFSWKHTRLALFSVYLIPAVLLTEIFRVPNFRTAFGEMSGTALFILSFAVVTFALGIGFFSVLRRWDLRPEKDFRTRFGIVSGIPLLLIVFAGFYALAVSG